MSKSMLIHYVATDADVISLTKLVMVMDKVELKEMEVTTETVL